ncbi:MULTISPECIES: TolC family protein [Niastella]|uniref:TolC family protein n=1 Tax=Niastella soli TaxID=2821487 RepID=A0ABS3Z0Q5_9BACT|nr:TolC family protein [Niastella soli]MBO9203744.1 TolC family protein [Niastella soli]
MRINAFPAIVIIGLLLLGTQENARAQSAQPLTLSDAINTGLKNYQSIQAKRSYLNASTALVQNTRNEYLPNVIASVQQDFGNINGQYGPLAAVGGVAGVSSSGPISPSQNWNSSFGGLYFLNTNWEVYSFGRLRSKINLASAQVQRDSADLMQEQFVQSVKIAGAYLNLLTAQRLLKTAQSNLDRSLYVKEVVTARTRTGLNAGVDSSIANSEVSRARLAIIDARNSELQYRNQLAQLLNVPPAEFSLDTAFISNAPVEVKTNAAVTQNPQVKFYQSRINQSDYATAYLKRSILPGLNLFGIIQTKGSGFDYTYSPTNPKYSQDYFEGIKPTRTNYVAGVSIAWNITSLAKIKNQVKAQQFLTEAYKNEYNLVTTQLQDQLILADQRIENSLQSVQEVPVQYKAASDAYLQKSVLYRNGLTNIVDVQQAQYALNRAEADLNVAYINVWQSLLLKAAASGDFDLFVKQVK